MIISPKLKPAVDNLLNQLKVLLQVDNIALYELTENDRIFKHFEGRYEENRGEQAFQVEEFGEEKTLEILADSHKLNKVIINDKGFFKGWDLCIPLKNTNSIILADDIYSANLFDEEQREFYNSIAQLTDNVITLLQETQGPIKRKAGYEHKALRDSLIYLTPSSEQYVMNYLAHSTGVEISASLLSMALEICKTILMSPYEGKPYSFGFIIGDKTNLSDDLKDILISFKEYIRIGDLLRYDKMFPIIDGMNAILLINKEGKCKDIFLIDSKTDMLDKYFCLKKITKDDETSMVFLVNTLENIKIFSRGSIYDYTTGKWKHKNFGKLIEKFEECLTKIFNKVDCDFFIKKILNTALLMSETGKGAIFILGSKEDILRCSKNWESYEHCKDFMVEKVEIAKINNINLLNMSKIDGATLIDVENQRLVKFGTSIPGGTEEDNKKIKVRGGNRHRSAAAATIMDGNSGKILALTVSEDGPITLFFEGKQYYKM